MKRLFVILLAFVLSQQIVKAQISFDPGEGCLNVVDFLTSAYLHPFFLNIWNYGSHYSNVIEGADCPSRLHPQETGLPTRQDVSAETAKPKKKTNLSICPL